MIQQQVYVITNITMFLDGLLVILAGYFAYYFNFRIQGPDWTMATELFVALVLGLMFINNYVFGKIGLYDDRRPSSVLKLCIEVSKGLFISFSILSVIVLVTKRYELSRSFFLLFASGSLMFILAGRIILREYIYYISQKATYSRKILIVGDEERAQLVSNLLDEQLSWGHEIVGRLSIDNSGSNLSFGTIEDLYENLRQKPIDEVVFAIEQSQSIPLSPYINLCKKIGVSVRILPSLWHIGDNNLSVERCQNVPFIVMKSASFNATGLLYKRILDIIGGLLGSLILLFIYPFVGLAIKLDSPGPVIFSQDRVGQNGRKFKLYKFRSMYKDAEKRKKELLQDNEMNGAIFKMKKDPRITRVGKILRKASLDEFPQFLNVLRGEMSLVGTRPPTVEEVQNYKDWHLRRISIKPGITGLWQISGRNRITDFNRIVELDCAYFDDWRFFDDIKIILKTIIVVLQRKGAI